MVLIFSFAPAKRAGSSVEQRWPAGPRGEPTGSSPSRQAAQVERQPSGRFVAGEMRTSLSVSSAPALALPSWRRREAGSEDLGAVPASHICPGKDAPTGGEWRAAPS